jgi:hypothetical protein
VQLARRRFIGAIISVAVDDGHAARTAMEEHLNPQLHLVAHDAAVHAVLLMDLLRIVQSMDAAAFQAQVSRAELELREAGKGSSPLHGRGSHSVLEDRLAWLRSVQIQASVASGTAADLRAPQAR